jgi:hypothetical protein
MRSLILAAGVAALAALTGACTGTENTPEAAAAAADKKGTEFELGGLRSTTPADWKEEAQKPGSMRMATFKLPHAEGDADDAELAIFFFKGNAGTVEQNLKRQEAKFEAPPGKELKDVTKVDKTKVGTFEATYQDIQGTYLSKFPPFDPNAKITKKAEYRQLYVIFETKEGQYYMTLLGPAKTIEKHKKAFDEWLKSFK